MDVISEPWRYSAIPRLIGSGRDDDRLLGVVINNMIVLDEGLLSVISDSSSVNV